MSRGLLVVLEGIDGSGKSTQARLLAERLRDSSGREVLLEREPTDGPWGRKARESASTGRLAPREELELFLRDRQQHVEEVIEPALTRGAIVVLDRYYFSTMAYQGARGFDPTAIREENESFAPKPDLLIIPDVDLDTSLARIGSRGDIANEFEQRDSLQRCREIFLSLRDEPFTRIVDASHDTIEEIASKIYALVDPLL